MSTKTTVDIREPLLNAAREVARGEGTTLRALIEEGLELALSNREKTGSYQLRDASFGGEGVRPGIREGDWSTLRSFIYEGRGE